MADAFTTNLYLDKPVVGASSDAWGTSWNSNADILDAMLGGSIYGLTLSTAGSSATMSIAAGGASGMALASAYTKTKSSWALGTAAGGLDTGAIANNTWYHFFLIERVDTGVVDVLFSLSASAPTMPANYTRKRLFFSWKTNGSAQWVTASQLGDRFLWGVNQIDVAAGTVPADSSAHLIAISVPTGIQVDAELIINPGYNSTVDYWLITSPDQTDSIPTAALNDVKFSSTFIGAYLPLSRRTNTSGQIRVRAINSGGGAPTGTYGIVSQSFVHPRGRY